MRLRRPCASRWLRRFWPGPLTLVLRRRADSGVSLLASGRPRHGGGPGPRAFGRADLLRATGRPIAAPSANRSGRVSPTEAAHVADEFGGSVALVLDDGRCPVGVESTVLDLTGAAPDLAAPRRRHVRGADRRCSGRSGFPMPIPARRNHQAMLASHYAPAYRSGWTRPTRVPGEALLAFGAACPSGLRGGAATSQPLRRPRRGGRQSVRDAAPSRPALLHRDRGDADPRARRSAARSTTACAAPPPRATADDKSASTTAQQRENIGAGPSEVGHQRAALLSAILFHAAYLSEEKFCEAITQCRSTSRTWPPKNLCASSRH